MRWFASLRSAKKYRASVSSAAGGYGIRPYVFVCAFGRKLHLLYYLLFFISYLSAARSRFSGCPFYKTSCLRLCR